MKYLLFILLVYNQLVNAQDTLNAKLVEPFSYNFHIENKRFNGKGADSLISEIQKSHFVLIGETHDDAKIAEFTDILLSVLKKKDYKYFLTEHGRSGLQLLLAEISNDSTIVSRICRINTYEYGRLNKYPFPFLTGIEDAHFLSTALNGGYDMYGIDQEFFYSFPFLFEKLYDYSSKSETIQKSYNVALTFLLDEYEKVAADKNYPFTKNLLESEEISTFFNHFNSNPDSRTIINDIKESWRIYNMNRTNRLQSFTMRGDLMKNRFLSFYDATRTNDSLSAKYLIKLGALHTMRGTTPLQIRDIGDIVHQTAIKNGQKDLNIYFMFRYYLDKEEELGYFDNSEGNSTWLNERKPLMLQGKPNMWTIIDLRRLQKMIEIKKLGVYKPIIDIMNRHDYVIIPPATRDVIENRNKF